MPIFCLCQMMTTRWAQLDLNTPILKVWKKCRKSQKVWNTYSRWNCKHCCKKQVCAHDLERHSKRPVPIWSVCNICYLKNKDHWNWIEVNFLQRCSCHNPFGCVWKNPRTWLPMVLNATTARDQHAMQLSTAWVMRIAASPPNVTATHIFLPHWSVYLTVAHT